MRYDVQIPVIDTRPFERIPNEAPRQINTIYCRNWQYQLAKGTVVIAVMWW